jgi:hypothetical protein
MCKRTISAFIRSRNPIPWSALLSPLPQRAVCMNARAAFGQDASNSSCAVVDQSVESE